MSNYTASSASRAIRLRFQPGIILALAAFCFATLVFAATPSSSTLNPVNGSSATWAGSGIAGATTDETTCVDGTDCDVYTVTLAGSPANYKGLVLAISISHQVSLNDYDLYVHKGGLTGPVIASATGGIPETSEAVVIDPTVSGTGVYTVHVVDSNVAPGDPYSGVASITTPPADSPAHGTAPTYANYQSPLGLGDSSGEPSIGANFNSGRIMSSGF